jgi:hypothetical protein
MTRMLKSLGSALAAIALIAAVAPAAQAETGGKLTAPQYPAIVTGVFQNATTIDIGEPLVRNVMCAATLDATLEGPTGPVSFAPTYSNCISGAESTLTTITTNGCQFAIEFRKPGTTGQPATTGGIYAQISCPPGQAIRIHVYPSLAKHTANEPVCTYDLPSTGWVLAGSFHNTMGGLAPEVDATVFAPFTGTSTISPGGMTCGGDALTGSVAIAFTGTYRLRGYVDNKTVEGARMALDVG